MRRLLFLLFAVSGFSGLIYESIWSHYLKLFLGSAAYAQSLVLAIFMGGMAAGSWIASRHSIRRHNLLLAYAIAEGLIGLFGLLFHNVFLQVMETSYDSIIPHLDAATFVQIYKWSIAALLILPQSVLLGMTFPLMSVGLIRWFPDKPGASLSILYFTNSFGAAIGVLASGFWMLPSFGLPGTVFTAGLINVLLATVVWLLVRRYAMSADIPEIAKERPGSAATLNFMLAVALLTGTASFIYEIGWIRMLNLVLGSSTHAFELMLSAFIFGLAFGGLWIRRRIDNILNPFRFLGIVQLAMGMLALLTLVMYGRTFEFMQWTLTVLARNDGAYSVFNLSSHLIALLIMLPVTFLAGMTLPLITHTLIKRGYGERSVGAVYAANTVGAIIGVFTAVHFGLPVLGLKALIVLGAGIDLALGLYLLWRASGSRQWRSMPAAATVLGLLAIVGTLLWVELDSYKMASGVYRSGRLLTPESSKILYHKDGKTASVDLVELGNGTRAIRTNGKSDASIVMNVAESPTSDESTMILLGTLPISINPGARTVANIGMGSGLTTHTVLRVPSVERVDTIEIEPAIVEAARGFRPRVEAPFTDSRSHIYLDDAKTYFSTQKAKYDIVISEPSNPWVSGVAGLFSVEFYKLISRHLNDGGLFVQWVQLYEFDVSLVASIIKALSPHFSDYVIYAPNNFDIIIVARADGKVPGPDPHVFSIPELAADLARVSIKNINDIQIRRIGDKALLDRFFASFPIPSNSDYFPVLDRLSTRARFLGSTAMPLVEELTGTSVPALEMLDTRVGNITATTVTASPKFRRANNTAAALSLREYLVNGADGSGDYQIPESLRRDAELLRLSARRCGLTRDWDTWFSSFFNVFSNMTPYLSAKELGSVWRHLGLDDCHARLSTEQKQWLLLFKAVNTRDAPAMAHTVSSLLGRARHLKQDHVNFLLAAGMLGNIAAGKTHDARFLWSTYSEQVGTRPEPWLLFLLLLSHAEMR